MFAIAENMYVEHAMYAMISTANPAFPNIKEIGAQQASAIRAFQTLFFACDLKKLLLSNARSIPQMTTLCGVTCLANISYILNR